MGVEPTGQRGSGGENLLRVENITVYVKLYSDNIFRGDRVARPAKRGQGPLWNGGKNCSRCLVGGFESHALRQKQTSILIQCWLTEKSSITGLFRILRAKTCRLSRRLFCFFEPISWKDAPAGASLPYLSWKGKGNVKRFRGSWKGSEVSWKGAHPHCTKNSFKFFSKGFVEKAVAE